MISDWCRLGLCQAGAGTHGEEETYSSLSRDSAYRKEFLSGKVPASSTDLPICCTHTPPPPSIRDWAYCAVRLKWSNGTVRNPEATQIRNGWRNWWSWDESISNVGGGGMWKRQQVGFCDSCASDVGCKLRGQGASSQRKAPNHGGQTLPAEVGAPHLDRHLNWSFVTIVGDTCIIRERVEPNFMILSSLRSCDVCRACLHRVDSMASFYTYYPLSLLQHSSQVGTVAVFCLLFPLPLLRILLP